jgi:hypothetical protein
MPAPTPKSENPVGALMAGCTARAASQEEAELLAQASSLYGSYTAKYNSCLVEYGMKMTVAANTRDDRALSEYAMARSRCFASAASDYLTPLAALVPELEAECARLQAVDDAPAASQPLAIPVYPDAPPFPLADLAAAGGCDGAPLSSQESAILDDATDLYNEMMAARAECTGTQMPGVVEAAMTGDQATLRVLNTQLNNCLSGAVGKYMPQLMAKRAEFEAECDRQAQPIEYPSYQYRSLPPSLMVELGAGCDPTTGPTAQEQVYLDEIGALEAQRRTSYSDCVNDGKALIQNAMNARATYTEVVGLQVNLINCVSGVLDSYAPTIEDVANDLQAHCASQGKQVDIVVDEPPLVTEDESESPPAQRGGMSMKGMLLIGGLILLAVGGGYYMTRKR